MICVYRPFGHRPFMAESEYTYCCSADHLCYSRYHGCITREEAANILGTHDGNYLVRAGLKTPGTYSLSFVYVIVW